MPADPRWTAILLAGQRPGPDAMAARFGVTAKALIPIAGRSMLDRVARTLLDTPSVARVVLLAQSPDALMVGDAAWLAAEPRVTRVAGTAGISASIAGIAGTPAAPWPVLVTTADHPLLTPSIVEDFLDRTTGADVTVGVVTRRRLLADHPDSRRTWLRFAGEAFTGANLFALAGPAAAPALEKWAEVERDRKKALKLVWHFGPLLALRAATRTITLDAALAQAGARLGLTARAVRIDASAAAIDVDKPADHVLAESILRARETPVSR